ncbi:unnamed protein product [Hermetia illucens]|uniref:Uncharacterized protein n=1 Tax=Hermetia illucens TaxID=343691 RepID=A0A7R8V8X5_HERIL|nr:unnamed protein product [Hermetia illucens]
MTILKAKGHSFPELKEADAMFAADSAPEWVNGKCSSKQRPLPKFGYERDVRIWEGCYTQLQKPSATKSRSSSGESDLPAEYLNSSLAQQSQTPPRKSDQELKEEEELQLALALNYSFT